MKPSASAEPGAGRLLAMARRTAGLSQAVVADRAGTSRTALSAYEHGSKSPSLDTAARLSTAMGFELEARRRPEPMLVAGSHGRQIVTLSPLPRLPVEQAFAVVELPLSVNWSEPGRRFDLADRADRARVYEMVLREGQASDLLTYVDGALLVDLWNDLVLPRDVRAAWAPIMGPLLAGRGATAAIGTAPQPARNRGLINTPPESTELGAVPKPPAPAVSQDGRRMGAVRSGRR